MAEAKRTATEQEMADDAIATANDRTEFTRVVVQWDGSEYVLEFNRTTVKRMEANGFDVSKLDAAPVTVAEELVVGAFEMHHPSMSRAARLMVWDALGGKVGDDGLFAALVQLYSVPVNSLMADPTTPTATWRRE